MVCKGNKHWVYFIRWSKDGSFVFFDVRNLGLGNWVIRLWTLTALVFKLYPICLFRLEFKFYATNRKCSFNRFFSPSEHWVHSPSVQTQHGIKQNRKNPLTFPRMRKIQVQYVCVFPNTGGRRFYLTDKMSTGGDWAFRDRDWPPRRSIFITHHHFFS